MQIFRRALILTHRYLGIPLSVLFVLWFVTGIGMIYVGGMPTLSAQARLAHLPALDLDAVRYTPAEAAERAASGFGRVAKDGGVALWDLLVQLFEASISFLNTVFS